MWTPNFNLDTIGLMPKQIYWNLTPAQLYEHAIANQEGIITSTGALMVDTGKFTGRDPENKFFVEDDLTKDTIWWGDINHPISKETYAKEKASMWEYIKGISVYARDVKACSDSKLSLHVRVVSSTAHHNLFVYNMFIRPDMKEALNMVPEYTIVCIPEYEGKFTPNKNFSLVNLSEKMILIGGTGYTGEIKKGIFTVLNYLLPHKHNMLSMHCSANVGEHGDTAIFFGLSGTGKTTLSADPNRWLIGDDEHGWAETGVFNFEGGCYAKVINLSKETEPEIWDAIKFGALLENTRCFPETRTVNFEDVSVTQNTRVSYPLYHVPKSLDPAIGGIPKNIFFLTADAFGVLPPISKLTPSQAMYHFISGYTAKVAGTEMGIVEPKMVFSACFGAPFLPLHPATYAKLLGEKMLKYNVNVWLVNTGWSGGPYGVGKRIKLSYTRAMINAAMEHKLDNAVYHADPVFGVLVPGSCPGVPFEILNPKFTWSDKDAYDAKAIYLGNAFVQNFKKFESFSSEDIKQGAPKV